MHEIRGRGHYRGRHRARRRASRIRRLALPLGIGAIVVGLIAVDGGSVDQHVAAGRTAGAASATVNRTWKSGVFAGYTPAADRGFAAWRGAPIQTATEFTPAVTWAQLEDPAQIIADWGSVHSVQLVLSTALWPGQGGNLKAASRGRYDHHFRELARNLVRGGLANTDIRLGWEFNGTWYRWSVQSPRQAKEFAAAWRHIVRAMRSVPDQQFGFDWCVTVPNAGGLNPALSYPGNRYVTEVAADVYDRNPGARVDPMQRWNALRLASYGLLWQAKFAALHHKPIAFPEWGLVSNPARPAAGGGDDPTFVREMYAWFASHNTSFEDYFDSVDHLGADFRISAPDGHFPNAAAAYRELYS
ncbi:MAG TPA: hypothetical protein VG708_05410 [Mycobacteriales bacterium]|nr:hypothetical protein [Mycobacteriales bacterium]